MISVALVVVLATAVGVIGEHRTRLAVPVARAALGLMLYALVPFISLVNFAHLHLAAGGRAGIALGYVALLLSGALAWAVSRRGLRLASPAVGAVVCTTILVNTGYLGNPLALAALGAGQVQSAIAYDQLVSGPMFFIVGFAIGAIFGTVASDTLRARVTAFVVRNPPLLAVIAGLLVPASLIPNALVTASHGVVLALLPLGFFVVGVNLSAERRSEAAGLFGRPDREVVIAVALRLLSAPVVLALVSATLIHLPRAYLLQAAMPSAVNGLVVGHAYGLDVKLITNTIVWSTVVVLAAGLVITLS